MPVTPELRRSRLLQKLLAKGFDQTTIEEDGSALVKCSSCAALVINGTATHETGCPNAVHECSGCDTLIPTRQKYCQDCM